QAVPDGAPQANGIFRWQARMDDYESRLAKAEKKKNVFSKKFLCGSYEKRARDESFHHEKTWHRDSYRECCDCVEPWDRHRSDHRGGHRQLLQRQVARKEDGKRRSL